MECSSCGRDMNEFDKFCKECGAKNTEYKAVYVTMENGKRVKRDWGDTSTGYISWDGQFGVRYNDSFLSGVDPTIRELVKYYNRNGIETLGSCAGHGDDGFITFVPDGDKRQIERIARKFGLKNIHWGDKTSSFIVLEFSPMEKYKNFEEIKE